MSRKSGKTKEMMKASGVTQQQIADQFGIGRSSVNQAIHGYISSRRIWDAVDHAAGLPAGTAESNARAERAQRKKGASK